MSDPGMKSGQAEVNAAASEIVKPKVSISKITFSSGQVFEIDENDKILIVGPNNSGKSTALREIRAAAGSGNGNNRKVVKFVSVIKKGSNNDVKSFLEENSDKVGERYHYKDFNILEVEVSSWKRTNLLSGPFLDICIKLIDANGRLKACEQVQGISPDKAKSKPQHMLCYNSELMHNISDIFCDAFGVGLTINYQTFGKIPIHVGEEPRCAEEASRETLQNFILSSDFAKQIKKLPLLDQQGDGMKSYAGILFEAIVEDRDITLIDEPEAFLHPPQMRKLGSTLASEVRGQLFVSTHSSDIMRGFVEKTKGHVRVWRIDRVGDVNRVYQASQDAIRELWEQPLLRYSNALDGIFHEQVIICEDDSDCRLYNYIADYLEEQGDRHWKDTAYVPTGGKSGIPKVAGILRNVGVPVKAIFDLDILSKEKEIETAVKAFGGDWKGDFKPLWKDVDNAVRQGVKPQTNSEIKSDIIKLIDESADDSLPKSKIESAMKQKSAWNMVKNHGESDLPKGQIRIKYRKLKRKLQNIGIYVVPVGEIEGFYPDLCEHGPAFVSYILENVDPNAADLSNLREFVVCVHEGQAAPIDNSSTSPQSAPVVEANSQLN